MTMLTPAEIPIVFQDVTPIPQNDGPHPVCQIDYREEFVMAYDYMRAILQSNEKSERALGLTALCLKMNPANYTIWHFRRECLTGLGFDSERLIDDLDLAADLGGRNPKNYQIWYHRRALLLLFLEQKQEPQKTTTTSTTPPTAPEESSTTTTTTKPRQQEEETQETTKVGDDEFASMIRQELSYIAEVFDEDAKNYHAWSHRQWLLKTANEEQLWKQEMEYVESLIKKDIRNNSAWNQRWFVSHRGQKAPLDVDHAARREVSFALEKAHLDPYNESPWRYLVGIVHEASSTSSSSSSLSLISDCQLRAAGPIREALQEAGRDPDACVPLNAARIDLLELLGTTETLDEAASLAERMGLDHDIIRAKYWKLRTEELRTKRKALQ